MFSKWIKHQVLLDESEMGDLLRELAPFSIYVVSEVVTSQNAKISFEDFLLNYGNYVRALKEGKIPDEKKLRRYFSSIWTVNDEALQFLPLKEERFLIKPKKPVIQLQSHHFFISAVDGRVHPMVLGKDSVTWGLQFSYPQIYEDPIEHTHHKVVASPEFPNTALYNALVKWLRENTVPTPINGKRVPIRTGRKCFDWIENHPQIISKQICLSN